MPRETTEIRIDEHGDETHESWLLIGASRVTVSPPCALFDSEIRHHHIVMVRVTRCTRRRNLHRDWLHSTKTLMELEMSQAQWGAFVSSFGDGTGVPATLRFLDGLVPQAPAESRFDHSHQEVREAGAEAVTQIAQSYEQVMEAFENGGKRALREALNSMGHTIRNTPANMEFAAQSLTEHVETVVAKARADIEAMVLTAQQQGELPEAPLLRLGSGNEARSK